MTYGERYCFSCTGYGKQMVMVDEERRCWQVIRVFDSIVYRLFTAQVVHRQQRKAPVPDAIMVVFKSIEHAQVWPQLVTALRRAGVMNLL